MKLTLDIVLTKTKDNKAIVNPVSMSVKTFECKVLKSAVIDESDEVLNLLVSLDAPVKSPELFCKLLDTADSVKFRNREKETGLFGIKSTNYCV